MTGPPQRGPFDVWAPRPQRVRLSVGDGIVEMVRGEDDWWSPAEPLQLSREETDYGYLIDDFGHAATRSAVATSAGGRPPALANPRPHRLRVDRRVLDRAAAGRGGDLRAARRHVHFGGHVRRRARPSRPPARPRCRLRRADAGQRGQRHPQLGLRRRALVCRARALRRARGLPAVRRRLPRGRPGRDPGRRLQPPRPVGQLPARVRSLPQAGQQHVGATWSTSTGTARPRCGATSSTTP